MPENYLLNRYSLSINRWASGYSHFAAFAAKPLRPLREPVLKESVYNPIKCISSRGLGTKLNTQRPRLVNDKSHHATIAG